MNELEWMQKTRQAWRQVHEKRQNNGHITIHCPYTWQQFRNWFREHYELGVSLGIHLKTNGDWPELLRACRRGMMLPNPWF